MRKVPKLAVNNIYILVINLKEIINCLLHSDHDYFNDTQQLIMK